MIPWVREKFAERRAKWVAARSKRSQHDRKGISANETNDAREPVIENCSNREINLISGEDNTAEVSTNKSTNIPFAGANRLHTQLKVGSVSQSKINIKSKSRQSPSNTSQTSPSCSQDNLLSTEKERIKLRIICPSARVLVFESDVNKRLAELKCEVMLELSDDSVSVPLFSPEVRILSPRYRLFRADNQGIELNETLTLRELKIRNNDSLVFVGRRFNVHAVIGQSRDWQYPREQDIDNATANIPNNTEELPMVDLNEIFYQSNLQFDVRKVLISLAQTSAMIIGSGPYASNLVEMLKQKLINKRNHENDTVQCLADMGFTRENAEYALQVNNGVYAMALEWLIMAQNNEVPVETPPMPIRRSKSSVSPSTIITNNDSILENTKALLEIVRIYSHRDIPPNQDTVNALQEMGFEENEILNALKKTCNNKAAAAEWLCGNRTGSLIELRDGLSKNSPILKTILEIPQVQINLSSPKIFLAFLFILENESSVRVWGGDNDTTSVITHILQRYHEEKHVMGINQFYSDRG